MYIEKAIWVVVCMTCFACLPKHDSAGQAAAVPSGYDSIFRTVCRHTGLSRGFDVEVFSERHRDASTDRDSCVVRLSSRDKVTGERLDSLSVTSMCYYAPMFSDCSRVLSYSTRFNRDWQVVDNDYGDIVVADLNFDSRDDIAVVNDSGGNGGPFYNYYLQDSNRRFVWSQYLTDSMVYFPGEIDARTRTLVTHVHAGACGVGEHVYLLSPADGSWLEKSHRIIDVCN